MMKKFLVLALVLGMASLANATLTLTTSGEITLSPSDELVLGIVATDIQDASIGGWIIVQGDTGILTADAPTLWEQSTANNMDPTVLADYIPILPDFGYDGVSDIIEWDIKDTVEPFDPIPNDMVIGNLIFHCEQYPGDVVLTLVSLDLEVFDTLTIHQIPEPMTMALLGLGGLFLRRRK